MNLLLRIPSVLLKKFKKYESSLYMASLDSESLFTNIPVNETMNNCVSDLNNKNHYNRSLTKEIF